MFYFPRLLWKSAEGGVMKLITAGLTNFDAFMNKDKRREGVELITKYFNASCTGRDSYFFKFLTCELLNFANVVGQIFLTDMFLGYQFQEFGRDVLSITQQDMTFRNDALNKVFPKVTKCNFQKYGFSGTVQKHDALCVLPQNIVNEKIFVLIYFWFVFLSAVSGIWLVYRLLTIISHDMRVNVIHARADRRVDKGVISACLSRHDASYMTRLGDFLLLYQITKNVNPLIIKDIFDALAPKHYRVAQDDEQDALLKSTAPEMT
jgi:hypothetical protein